MELHAAVLQVLVTLGLGGLILFLRFRYHAAYMGWFAAAFGLYVVRLGAIIVFLATDDWIWLYWHQVVTGWMALTLLWGALVFARRARRRPAYLLALLFPPAWSYVAIYQLDNFMLAALPAVSFLSLATLATAWIFLRHWRAVRSTGAFVLAIALLVWGLHHLDYPFLRARGAWVPWGYYLDIVFTLAVGTGMLLLIQDDLRSGLTALLTLAADLQRERSGRDTLAALLERPLSLPSVSGAALYTASPGGPRCLAGAGVCAGWQGQVAAGGEGAAIDAALRRGQPATLGDWRGPAGTFPFAGVLPVQRGAESRDALVILAQSRVPFTALDEDFLVALGQQIGAALSHADLTQRLEARTTELQRLQQRMVQQHEEERRRLSLHLHDQSAQLFTAVKLQLGIMREVVDAPVRERLTRVMGLLDEGLDGLRNVVNDLRPSLLDDLGLAPALRSLAAEWEHRTGLEVRMTIDALPALSRDAELALYRALQESLSNAAAHADARQVEVHLAGTNGGVRLDVTDDGRGFPPRQVIEGKERAGHLGLAGMRERITALGGTLETGGAPGGGARITATLPAA